MISYSNDVKILNIKYLISTYININISIAHRILSQMIYNLDFGTIASRLAKKTAKTLIFEGF